MKSRMALVVAIILGLISASGVYTVIEKIRADAARFTNYVTVLKASRTIEEGEIFGPDHVIEVDIPDEFVPKQSIRRDDLNRFLRQKVIKTIPAGGHILSDYFIRRIDDISKKITSGLRLVSFPVEYHEGVSGLLRPGQRIDVWGSFNLKVMLYPQRDPVTGELRPITAEELEEKIRDMRTEVGQLMASLRQENRSQYDEYVRSLAQYLRDIASTGEAGSGSVTLPVLHKVQVAAVDSATDRFEGEAYKTVTVYVSPSDVGRLVWASNEGRLHVVLRNAVDPTSPAEPPYSSRSLFLPENQNPWLRQSSGERGPDPR